MWLILIEFLMANCQGRKRDRTMNITINNYWMRWVWCEDLYSERGESVIPLGLRRGDQYNSLHHTKAGRIHNLFYNGIPLIRSPMGKKKIGRINGMAILSGLAQISWLEEGRNDKYTVQRILTSWTMFSLINNRNVDIAYSNW